jgi:hypothetical protein
MLLFVDQNVIIALLVTVIIVIFVLNMKPTEFLVGPAIGDKGYVRFYSDFGMEDLLFRMDGSEPDADQPKYIKYDLKGDARSMDINIPAEGPDGRRVEIWARYPYKNVGTSLTDFYNIYDIPEYDYGVHPNLKLVATVLPGQRFKSDNIVPSKRFLVMVKI